MNPESALAKIFGKDGVSTHKAELLSYATDASQIFGTALAVVFPKDEDHIRKLIILASQRNYPLVPRGGGTALTGAVVPDNAIVVDFSRMDRIIQINVKTKEAILEPGVIVDDLNMELRQFGLYFPVIPSSHEVCTLGGMVAANAAGLHALKYGKTEDWVNGMKTIDGTGKSYTFNEKNDFIGTEGILGFITEIKVKVTPLMPHTYLTLTRCKDLPQMIGDVEELAKDSKIVSLEFLDPITSKLLKLPESYHLIAEFVGEGEDSDLMELREGASVVLGGEGYLTTADPKLSSDKMEEFLTWIKENGIPCFGHIGYGIIHPRFRDDQGELIKEMFQLVQKLGGEISGEHGIGIIKKEYLDPDRKAELKGLKYMYDPQGIINPGKVI